MVNNDQPLNEYRDEGFIAKAFPFLFPYGNGRSIWVPLLFVCHLEIVDWLIGDYLQLRNHQPRLSDYIKFLLQYHDRRFIRDRRFLFYAMNLAQRHHALSAASAFMRLSSLHTRATAADVINRLRNEPTFSKKIMVYANRLRSTRAYWFQRRGELLDMAQQLAHDGTGLPAVFFTLSAADYHWPDLFRLLAPGRNVSEAEHDNPDVVAYFFKRRCEVFINTVLKPIFGVVDHWLRFEWQWHGSPHLHGLLWLDSTPNLDVSWQKK